MDKYTYIHEYVASEVNTLVSIYRLSPDIHNFRSITITITCYNTGKYTGLYNTLYPQKLELTSPTSGGCSVGIVRSQTKATEFVLYVTLSKAIPVTGRGGLRVV
jgi:hypothetical protein